MGSFLIQKHTKIAENFTAVISQTADWRRAKCVKVKWVHVSYEKLTPTFRSLPTFYGELKKCGDLDCRPKSLLNLSIGFHNGPTYRKCRTSRLGATMTGPYKLIDISSHNFHKGFCLDLREKGICWIIENPAADCRVLLPKIHQKLGEFEIMTDAYSAVLSR